MSLRTYAAVGAEVLAVVVVVSLAVGAVLGQPVLLSYVETGSMSPTMDPGDGFVAVPSALAGDVDEGDVVAFRAEELHGGGLTTHRVVGETDRGYVTKGDANPFTDQDGDEPPVTDEQIVAHALQVGGTVVVIPHLGTAVAAVQDLLLGIQSGLAALLGVEALFGTQGIGLLLFGAGILLFVGALAVDVLSGPRRERNRSRRRAAVIDTRTVAILLLAAVLVPANAAMLLPGGVQQTELDGDRVAASDAVGADGTVTWEYDVRNSGYVPLAFVVEPDDDGVAVERERFVVWPGQERTVSIAVDAPPPGERRVAGVVEHRYLLVLPQSALGALHDVHPLVPVGVVNAVLGGAVLGLLARTVGLGRVRARDRGPSFATRLRRWLG